MINRRPKIIGYRLASVRPFGLTGDALEVTPHPGVFASRPSALAHVMGDNTRVIELRRGGRSSADPAGQPRPGWWHVVCAAGHVELPCATWQSADRALERIERHRECSYQHRIITRHPDVIALFQ
ncbi:unnamed protein product [[Actinomadura] parvosata subsp. kistnae]|uniref:Uncharacterized protein n=1 Tax=[Actinomadura] parvosata subsp. kistnae TaxID=1909395 RepID=A0A1U9ZXW5_9ACTN|nr:hypothetical protein [Nonomuraea sp. ATCC 55076]AQZ62795.1 hypothetical protein BKM31_16195 [Nonomuraea sp. ATCC 55076]SPL98317.1 unnamed protein product [Actinomadura parvosata subsp. kistnae]